MMKEKPEKTKEKTENADKALEIMINKVNDKIGELGNRTKDLCDVLNEMQGAFDSIRNIPRETKLEYEQLEKIRLEWKSQAEKIEQDYDKATKKSVGGAAAGAALGAAVVTIAPTVAMGIATTFGVASTGTAISALSGAAATNAALAWLGGGAIAAGGGGMAAGNALLALAGPVGWAIAGTALAVSGVVLGITLYEKSRLQNVFDGIRERDTKKYDLACRDIDLRIERVIEETKKLKEAMDEIGTFGKDYKKMSGKQRDTLGNYVNLMRASTRLLVNPIDAFVPKYTEDDFNRFIMYKGKKADTKKCEEMKQAIIILANLLYRIEVDDKDKKLLCKAFKANKDALQAMGITKKELDTDIFDAVEEALSLM